METVTLFFVIVEMNRGHIIKGSVHLQTADNTMKNRENMNYYDIIKCIVFQFRRTYKGILIKAFARGNADQNIRPDAVNQADHTFQRVGTTCNFQQL